MKFWDMSAVVPLCVQETLSATVQDILVEDPYDGRVWGTRTECISALMHQLREDSWTPTDERAARHVLYALTQTWIEMQPSEELHSMAERLLAVHPLRTADALQLAAAILWCQGLTTGQDFVSLDRRLCDVGYREGFTVLPKGVLRIAGLNGLVSKPYTGSAPGLTF